jgi:hypothetical protein
LGFTVTGKLIPETVKPAPATVAALTVTAEVPAEVRITVCVVAVLRLTVPNDMLDKLTLSVGTDAPSCRANVLATLFAPAVRVAVAAVLTVETVAVKFAEAAPAATVTDAGTATAELLLARLTVKPPAGAAVLSETLQLSVPAAVIDPLVQVRPLSTGTPVPLRLIKVEAPDDELLVSVREPAAAPEAVGSNCTVKVAV